MPSINVNGAAARLLATGALAKAGLCLHYCWLAISQGRVHYITGGTDTAYNTWLAVPADQRHSSRDVPKDFPAFLGKKFLSAAGDVIISNGDGTFVATDWPKSKQVGVCTLEQREKQTGRKFVGWASSMGGHELESTTTAGIGTPILNRKKTRIMYVRRSSNGDVALMQDGRTVIFTNPTEYGQHRTILETYNIANPDDLQFVPPADLTKVVGLDETGWAIAVKFHGGTASGGATGMAVEQIVQASEGRIISAIPKTFRADK